MCTSPTAVLFRLCSRKSVEAKLKSSVFLFFVLGFCVMFHFRDSATAINVFEDSWPMVESTHKLLIIIEP